MFSRVLGSILLGFLGLLGILVNASSGEFDDSDSFYENKGPRVKTGPTRGEVRSRNKNGRWRAKRSDAGSSRE